MNLPNSETDRLIALQRGGILDTPPEPFFDHITGLAAQFFGTPVATISFVDRDRTWFKSRHGFEPIDLARQASFCAHTILGHEPLVIPDARADRRFSAFEIVSRPPGIRFYAGVPLLLRGGFAIGALAVMDTHPRAAPDESQLGALRSFGALVEHEIERRFAQCLPPLQDQRSPQQMVDSLPAMVWMSDAHGQVTLMSRNWSDFSGGSFEQGPGQAWLDSIHPEDRPRVLAHLRATHPQKADIAFECRIRRADSEYCWILNQGRPRFDPDGGFAGYVGICVDINDSKKTVQALHGAEERFRVAAENASDLIYEWDIPGNRVTTFGDFPLRLGYTEQEIPRTLEDWIAVVHPDDRARVSAAIQRMLHHGEPLRVEYRTLRHDGAIHYWSDRGSVLLNAAGKPQKLIGVMSEVTDRKRARQALSELAAIVQCSEDAIISASLDGIVRTWNAAAEKLYGYRAHEICGRSIASIVPPEYAEDQAEIIRKARQGESVFRHETVRLRKDGSRVPVSLSVSTVKGPDGRPVALASVTSDITQLKEAQAVRREAEERLLLAQDAAGIGIWDWDPSTNAAVGSAQFFGLYGLAPRDSPMAQSEWISLVHPDDRERIQASLTKLLPVADRLETEFRVVWPDGSVHRLISKARIERDGARRVVRAIGVNLDVTVLKQAEQARRESDDRYENLFRTMAQGVVYFGTEGEILSANPAAEEMLGLTLDQMRGRRRIDLNWDAHHPDGTPLPPEDSPSLAALRTGSASRDVVVSIRNLRSRKRRWLTVDAMPQFRPGEPRPYQVYTILQDITRRVKAEQLLRASEERFRLLIEHGQEIISVVDPDAAIRYMSPSVEKVTGYTPDSLIGVNALDLIHPDDQPAVRRLLAQIASSPNGTATAQYRLRHHDGSWRYTETAATSALHIRGLQGIICNSRDITDAKNFEQELLLSRDQLRRLAAHAENTREQERIRIAREIHDELGQTLSALRLDLERLAIKYFPGNPTARKELTRRVPDMIRNIDLAILTVRRISAELRPGVLDHLGLAAALEWQIDQFQSRTGIQCRCRGLARSFSLGAEPSTAVFRIFQEILTNIVRHAKASTVTIKVGVKADCFTLSVADDGYGLNPKHLSDPRALGLLGMRERAILLGGSVEFSPRRGGGTVVTVRIPLKPSAAAPAMSPPAMEELAPASGTTSPRILIAEDHAIYRKGLKALIAETCPGAYCSEVETADAALAALRAKHWDILVLDLSMPGKSGMAVLAAMPSRVPVLVISMHEGAAYASRIRRAGASGYISKSSSLDQIAAAFTTVLAGHKYFLT